MLEPRLASSILIAALRRKIEAAGGFATVLAKGDPVAGAILLVCLPERNSPYGDASTSTGLAQESGGKPVILEREPTFDGPGKWVRVAAQHTENEEKLSQYLAKRRASDPDIWIIELDTAQAERFAAEIISSA